MVKKCFNDDLKTRTAAFAARVRAFVKNIPMTFENQDDMKQLVRSSGSVAANYLEADEAESKKDFAHRCKICRKESKESRLWLQLIRHGIPAHKFQECDALIQESSEFILIFSAIIRKSGFDHGIARP
ncbi:hypothetical protein A3C37_02590 [Candidatus Peribacteria bacterium RIFCSPHIGHO2_02_FULL_53_20]|nr:MAG: hypothetical protein A3C37_02590 [Candidatus Peribacteria bacterium RIFCSPHIGHO2_02_FULL_53_20]OGJ66726.1 MAG: hypothetical protein A3B61_02625 [Candidatus Peribacteria bacterium RIFCSPLOWO2_01_FULL_53_10]